MLVAIALILLIVGSVLFHFLSPWYFTPIASNWGTIVDTIGKPVKLLLRSKDVLHDFTVAQIRGKMDLVPGMITHFWFTPTRAGTFDVLCEELCGIAHFAMRGRMVVEDENAVRAWADTYPT